MFMPAIFEVGPFDEVEPIDRCPQTATDRCVSTCVQDNPTRRHCDCRSGRQDQRAHDFAP
jgi:hypothetical protein